MYKVFIMYGEPKNETDITYSKPEVLESFENKDRLKQWFAERIYTMLCDDMKIQKHDGILKSIEVDYYNYKSKIIFINGCAIKYFIEERKQ